MEVRREVVQDEFSRIYNGNKSMFEFDVAEGETGKK